MPFAAKLRCVAYAVIAVVALIATWSQNVAYLGGAALSSFPTDLKVNPATRSFTVDLLLLFLAAAILMVVEARRHRIRYVWAYLVGGALIAISVTFPLFLIAREWRTAGTDTARLTVVDTALLTVIGILTFAMVIWVDWL
jgi:hypothetical protein